MRTVEDAELDAALVGGDRHRAAQRIDFLDQVALADAADRRVAAHLSERLDVVRQQQRLAAHAGGRQGGLGAGMAAADDDDVEFLGVEHLDGPASSGEPRANPRFYRPGHLRALLVLESRS